MGSDYRWTEQVPKLFIIDDHKLFASGLAGLLEDDLPEAAIEVYSEVETALEAANATGPDVALLDYYLPGLSGAEAIGKLREASPGTKVIVISASLSPADHQVSEAAGAVASPMSTSSGVSVPCGPPQPSSKLAMVTSAMDNTNFQEKMLTPT